MTALQRIQRAGFEVSLSGDTFTVSPASRLTPEQRDFLKTHKAEIIRELEASNAAATASDPLLVEVWTPSGTPMTTRADNAEHAAWLQRLNPKHRTAILAWLHFIGETDQALIDDVLDYCASNPEALSYYLKRAEEVPLPDDRHHCRECLHLNSGGYCIRHRFRPVDDLPRRCEDFNDSRIQQ